MECKGVVSCQFSRDMLSYHVSSRFRWVFCQLEILRRSEPWNLRGILEKLPKTLDEIYERVLKDINEDINEDNRDHARRLLHCLAVAIRPLRVDELAEILAFDFDDVQGGAPKFHAGRRRKDKEEAVLSTCSSLIAIVDSHGDRVVQFSHFSVKEFLTSDRLASSTEDVSRYHILPGPAHTILAQACLGFLLHLDDHVDKESVKGFPLANYAAQHWVAHAQFEDVASRVKDGMRSLFDPDKPHFVAWLGIYNIDPRTGCHRSDILNPLYHSALCGFHDLVEHLISNHPQLVNVIGGEFGSPLLAALFGKDIWVAEFLLRHGGQVDIRGRDRMTPLHNVVQDWESENAIDAMSFLLEHGADVNSRDQYLCTPLHLVAIWGAFEEAQVLLERGADVDSRDIYGETPLHSFPEEDDPESRIPLLLLERGANVNAQSKNGDTPLLAAAGSHRAIHSRVLLEHGAEPNVKNNDGKTSLHLLFVNSEGSEWDTDHLARDYVLGLARLLLEHGTNVNVQDKDYTTPLHLAMELKAWDLARIFLEHGAEPNMKNNEGKTSLHLLLERGFYDYEVNDVLVVERLLLECGADVNAQDEDNSTPLHLASNLNHPRPKIAQIILDRANEEKYRRRARLLMSLEGEYNFQRHSLNASQFH
jgi:ankyrin repeat protein